MHVDWGPTARLPQAARPGITQRQARIFFGCAFLTMPLGFLALTPRVVVLWIVVLGLLVVGLVRHERRRALSSSFPSVSDTISRRSWLWRLALLVGYAFAQVWYLRSPFHALVEGSLGAPLDRALMLAPFVAILLGKDWYLGVLPALAAGAVLGWIGADGAAGTMLLFAAIGACLILAGLVGKSGLPRAETK